MLCENCLTVCNTIIVPMIYFRNHNNIRILVMYTIRVYLKRIYFSVCTFWRGLALSSPPPPPFLACKLNSGVIFFFYTYRVQRRTHVPGTGRTRSLRQFRYGVPDAVPGGHRRQLERHYERRAPRRLRRRSRLREKLLRGRRHSSNVFRHFRVDGAVRVGQRGGGGAHETPRRIPQTGKPNVGRNITLRSQLKT